MVGLVLIAAGGASGALARYGVDRAIMVPNDLVVKNGDFPWGTLIVNISGTMLLAALFAFVEYHTEIRSELWLLLAVGFLGSYTTFSTVALDAVLLSEANRLGSAVVYLVLMPVVGLAAGVLTYAGARTLLT